MRALSSPQIYVVLLPLVVVVVVVEMMMMMNNVGAGRKIHCFSVSPRLTSSSSCSPRLDDGDLSATFQVTTRRTPRSTDPRSTTRRTTTPRRCYRECLARRPAPPPPPEPAPPARQVRPLPPAPTARLSRRSPHGVRPEPQHVRNALHVYGALCDVRGSCVRAPVCVNVWRYGRLIHPIDFVRLIENGVF